MLLKYDTHILEIRVFQYIMQHASGCVVKVADLPAHLCVFQKPGHT